MTANRDSRRGFLRYLAAGTTSLDAIDRNYLVG